MTKLQVMVGGVGIEAEVEVGEVDAMPLVVVVVRCKGDSDLHALNLYNSAPGIAYMQAATWVIESLRAAAQQPEIKLQAMKEES